MKKLILPLFLLGLLFAQGCQKTEIAPAGADPQLGDRANCEHLVVVPAGSVDALAGAIDDVCTGGTVRLAAGVHTENAGVVIDKKIRLEGEEGAVLKVNTAAAGTYPLVLDVALTVDHATGTRIENIRIEPVSADPGGTGILLYHSDKALVKNCEVVNHQNGIMVEKSDNTELNGNFVDINPSLWAGGVDAHAMIIVNGEGTKITGNELTNAFFGIWICGVGGTYSGNETYGNFVGMILCKVPVGGYVLPDGTPVEAEHSGANFTVMNNYSHDNFDAGYLVIDGANNNHLVNNRGGDNGTYDIECVGDSYRFGFFTPTSYNNLVNAGSWDVLMKDCGLDNTLIGGTQVDINLDPCF